MIRLSKIGTDCQIAQGNSASNRIRPLLFGSLSLFCGQLTNRIRNGNSVPFPLSTLLWLASFVQRFGMWLRLRKTPTRVAAHVVSFGNITAGGVGKTPAVIERANRELAAGKKVAVLTRGYGAAPVREPILLAPGKKDADAVKRFGDEAVLIAKRTPGVWIVRAADRIAGADAAIEKGCDVLLMDDGFQAVALARDENILLIDTANPFGNGHVIPRGILREPLPAINRATEIILTRCDQSPDNLSAIEQTIRQYAPGVPITRTRHKPTGLWRVCDGSEAPLSLLQSMSIRVVCGIGNPDAFCQTLRELGANITETHPLPDHGEIPDTLLKASIPIVMTEKDAMRVNNVTSPEVYALAIALKTYG